jgi:hypothetical protein
VTSVSLWDHSPRLRFNFRDRTVWNADGELVAEWRHSIRRPEIVQLFETGAEAYELAISAPLAVRRMHPHETWDGRGSYVGQVHDSQVFDAQDARIGTLSMPKRSSTWKLLDKDHERSLADIEKEPGWLRDMLGRPVWQLRIPTPLPRDLYALAITSVFWCVDLDNFAV